GVCAVFTVTMHVLLLYSHGDHHVLHSFPTRRSSDLRLATNVVTAVEWREAALDLTHLRLDSDGDGLTDVLEALLLTDSGSADSRSEEHTSELQSRENLVCRLLLEKKKNYTL